MTAVVEEITTERLLDAAGEVFAEQGFRSATVREICARAGANIASVNYHFGDKMCLYIAVLRKSMGADSPSGIPALGKDSSDPETALRAIIRRTLHRMFVGGECEAWHVRIMAHELAQPSAALDRVVEEAIAPNYLVLRKVLSRILGTRPGDDLTRLCAHSVIAQVVHYSHGRQVIARLWPDLEFTADRLDRIAAHIAEFSMSGIRAVAKKKGSTV